MNEDNSFFGAMTSEEKKYYEANIAPKNNEYTFYGFGSRVCIRENKFWLDYMSFGHGGFSVIKEINESEYLGVLSGQLSFADIIKKYPQVDGDVERGKLIEQRWNTLGLD